MRQVVAEFRLGKIHAIDLPCENLKMSLGGGTRVEFNNVCNSDHPRIAHRKQISALMEKPNWNPFSEQIFKHILLLFCLQKWNTTRKTRICKTRYKKIGILRGKIESTCACTQSDERLACLRSVSDWEVPLLQIFSQEVTNSYDVRYFILDDIGKENKFTQNPYGLCHIIIPI